MLKGNISDNFTEAVAIVDSKMKTVAQAIINCGGIIGHIKSIITSENEKCMISITDMEIGSQKRFMDEKTARFEMVVIVFCIGEDKLCEIIHSVED
ncbi:hypothetical protein TREPR_1562 [Treponema primitia ZAS-2]|uniref:Uncharacterized protein n=1 Tax=Treponema primitia (strain ATCC BAA-887 / DSM 12427 / ZAS-2) TaxID=545694 RepID=F5YPE0_TREPZ|nr:hypothetical protein TREPR_1562 [Treponema primitia ZAS-2]